MGRIKGHFEWDDDGLTPGRKREGGLHQNLYDSAGNLKGNARFIPDKGADREPLVVTETVYVHIDERRNTRQDEELQEAINALVRLAILYGVAKAKPLAEQWWQQSARPALQAKREQLRERRSLRRPTKSRVIDTAAADSPRQVAAAVTDDSRSDMSSAEAQARYLAALAARAFSDEQIKLVTNADIVDGGGIEQVERALAALPAAQVTALVRAMVHNPTMLGEDTLAELASTLARRSINSQSDQPR